MDNQEESIYSGMFDAASRDTYITEEGGGGLGETTNLLNNKIYELTAGMDFPLDI